MGAIAGSEECEAGLVALLIESIRKVKSSLDTICAGYLRDKFRLQSSRSSDDDPPDAGSGYASLSASAMPRRLPRLRRFPRRALGGASCVTRASLER